MYKVGLITAKKKGPAYLFQSSGVDLGIISLEAYLAEKCSDTEVLVTEEIEDLLKFKPDMTGVSATSENYPLAIKIANDVKSKCGSVAIIGGSHITTCPESLNPIFDLGVVGEGEDTFLEVLKLYKKGSPKQGDLKNIPGIVFYDKKNLITTVPRPPIKDLDVLPMPNRKKWVQNIGMAYLMSARGCMYNCYFCAACKVWKGLRFFSVEHVVNEIRDIADKFHPKAIRIFDDIFTVNKERVKNITSKMIDGGLTKHTRYFCWTRANLIDQEYVDLLKEANFIHVGFGVESASEKMMKRLKGDEVSLGAVQSAIDMLSKAGINIGLTFIIGTPGESVKDLDKLYAFIDKNAEKILDIEINPMLTFPGTPLWIYAKEKGFVSKDMDWDRLDDTAVLLTFNFDKYIYLNEDRVSRKTFFKYVEKLKDLYKKINLRPKNFEFMDKTFPIAVFPSRLNRLS